MARRKTTNDTPAPEPTKGQAAEVRTDQDETVTMTGRLCADPVLRRTKSGKPVTTIRLAVNNPGADATFHSVVVWNRNAEVVCEYLRKGRSVEISGRPQERSYEAADGTQVQVSEIVAWRVQFLGRQPAQSATEKEVA
jgi:single-strand DNA-binding protein